MVPVWDYIRLSHRTDGKGKPLTNEYWESTEHIQPSGILEIKPLLNLNQGNECEEHETLGLTSAVNSPRSLNDDENSTREMGRKEQVHKLISHSFEQRINWEEYHGMIVREVASPA